MKIALLGDAAFYGKFCLLNGSPKLLLEKTASILNTFDYVVLNLEAPFALAEAKQFGHKSAYIKSDPINVELLKYLGVDAVCIANNHMFDFGYESYELTKKILSDNDISYFGTENKDLKLDIQNNKIAFSGYCCFSSNPINATSKGVNPYDYKSVKKKLIEDKSLGYASILSIHAGQEHVNFPNYDHIEMARKLSSVHPYVYYGHHPHVLQGVEEYCNSLLAYSLGNFCFDDVYSNKSTSPLVEMNQNNKESAILSLEYINSKLIDYEFIPLYDGQVCEEQQKVQILQNIQNYSSFIGVEKDQYIKERFQLLNKYLQSRKSKRDLNWFIKRLNYNSFKIIKNGYQNKKKYNECIKDYL